MKQVYLVPNIITAFGLACGLFVIFKVNMIEPGTGGYEIMIKASLLLLLAAFADFVDGAVARALKAESEFGIMFDSLADAVSFGVAPSVLLLKGLSVQQETIYSFIIAFGVMVYSLCGILRLVRYNVKSMEPRKNVVELAVGKNHFTGLPITAAAAAAVSANLLFLSPFINYFGLVSHSTKVISLALIMLFLGYLMVSRWKFPSLKALHFRVPSFHLAFFSVIFAVLVLYGVLYYFPIALAFFSWGYIVVAFVLATIRIIAGKKSKTLEEYEPEPDEED